MNIDFMWWLSLFTLSSGLIWLVDVLWWKKQRGIGEKEPKIVEYAHGFFPVFLCVVIIRSFLGQIYHVPTGSLEPTVATGDYILVTQYNYGLRLPITNTTLVKTGEPKRGDIVVFKWPVNPRIDFVKRVIGLPGDRISYVNHVLSVNGRVMLQTPVGYTTDNDGTAEHSWPVEIFSENLDGVKHLIYVCKDDARCPASDENFYNLTVPPGHYFMMGDNRNNSEDSRNWGFVSESALVGKANFVLFSWDPLQGAARWSRIGRSI